MYGEQVSPSEVTPVLTSDVQELSEDQRMVRRDFIVTMLRNLGIATPETLAQIQADPLSNHGHVETYFTYMEGEADLKKIAVECGVPLTEVVVKRNESLQKLRAFINENAAKPLKRLDLSAVQLPI